MGTSPWITFKFKEVKRVDMAMDVYLPSDEQLRKSGKERAPVLVYYHGADRFHSQRVRPGPAHLSPSHAQGAGCALGTEDGTTGSVGGSSVGPFPAPSSRYMPRG